MEAALSFITEFFNRFFSAEIVMEYNWTTVKAIFEGGVALLLVLSAIGCIIGLLKGFEEDELIGAIKGLYAGAIVAILIYLILCCIWYGLVCWVVPFIVNTATFVGGISVIAAVVCGFIVGLVCYVKSFVDNINPFIDSDYLYNTKLKSHDNKFYQENVRHKSYFFGPGYFALWKTILGAWDYNFSSISDFKYFISDHGKVVFIIGLLPLVFYALSVLIAGSITTIVFSLLHIAIMLAFMLLIYALFTISWTIDRVYLLYKSINTNCSYDQTRVVIPYFRCSNPNCQAMHTRLVPSSYGIWFHRCKCGTLLPTMFILGRSKLQACCPSCERALSTSSSSQFSVSVIGGTSSGKTVWLAAFWQKLFERLDSMNSVSQYTIHDKYKSLFSNLHDMYNGHGSGNTENLENTSIMYSTVIQSQKLKSDKQFSIFDIAGESFNNSELGNMLPQKHFRDSNGIVFFIDPLSSEILRRKAVSLGDDINGVSPMDPNEVLNNFTTYLTTVITSCGITKRITTPMAVIISKADLKSVNEYISDDIIESLQASSPQELKTYEDARNEACRCFLTDIGFGDVVEHLNGRYTNVSYFLTSAIGHTENGDKYSPQHVLDPIDWIIKQSDAALGSLFNGVVKF